MPFDSLCHAEYPPVSVSRKLLSRTPPETPPPNQCELPHVQAANQSHCLPARFKQTKAGSRAAGQPGTYCLSLTTLRCMVTSNLASKHNTLSYTIVYR
jgi:hypothetical protein